MDKKKLLAELLVNESNKRLFPQQELDYVIDVSFENKPSYIFIKVIWKNTKGIVYRSHWVKWK